jgi:proteic killer suppression protein
MIQSFCHKGLQELFLSGKTPKLNQSHLNRIKKILAMIHAAYTIKDLANNPGLRLHKLKKPPYTGYWSVDISGNYRIIFQFENGNATNLNYLATH